MSSINEAYARIDYGMLVSMQNQINELKKLINTGKFATINGENFSVKKTAIFAGRKNVAQKENVVTINFGNTFAEVPVVSVTPAGNSGGNHKPEDVSILIKEVTKGKATIEIYRKKEALSMRLHVIAVGVANKR